MMKLKDFDIVQDELLGKKGTPERDAFEKDVAEAVQAYKIGEAISSKSNARGAWSSRRCAKGTNLQTRERQKHNV